jgi:hypothetical protein
MKKLINDPAGVVAEALRGMAAAHPGLRVDQQNKVIYRADAPVSGKMPSRLWAWSLGSCQIYRCKAPTLRVSCPATHKKRVIALSI